MREVECQSGLSEGAVRRLNVVPVLRRKIDDNVSCVQRIVFFKQSGGFSCHPLCLEVRIEAPGLRDVNFIASAWLTFHDVFPEETLHVVRAIFFRCVRQKDLDAFFSLLLQIVKQFVLLPVSDSLRSEVCEKEVFIETFSEQGQHLVLRYVRRRQFKVLFVNYNQILHLFLEGFVLRSVFSEAKGRGGISVVKEPGKQALHVSGKARMSRTLPECLQFILRLLDCK